MRFRVTPRRDRGVEIPTKELQKRESFVGELDIFWLRDEVRGGYLQVASLRSTDVPSQYLLPELREVQISGMATHAFGLRGYERIEGRRGLVHVVQEWWVRPP